MRSTAAPVPRLAAPEITVARDANGDFVDADGRVIIFKIAGTPPYMLMIDGRCIRRTPTLTAARQAAYRHLHPGPTLPPPPRAR